MEVNAPTANPRTIPGKYRSSTTRGPHTREEAKTQEAMDAVQDAPDLDMENLNGKSADDGFRIGRQTALPGKLSCI
jgi:hypothetical protein